MAKKKTDEDLEFWKNKWWWVFKVAPLVVAGIFFLILWLNGVF